jgi:flavin reductase (DIM6/NTAB) family NADH-FMN oxidoreductase RutF
MEKIKGKDIGEFYRHSPMAVALVTVHANGKDSGMPAAWISPVSFNPPLFGVSISPKRHTHSMIVSAGEFVLNFLPLDKANIHAQFGGCSGKDVDKFKKFAVKAHKGDMVSAPILEDAYAAFECKLHGRQVFGDHEWFVGEILCIHRKEDSMSKDGVLNLKSLKPSLFLGQETYACVSGSGVKVLDRRSFQ